MSEVHSPHLSSHLGVPARTSNQLTEVTIGFADPPILGGYPSSPGNIGVISTNRGLLANGQVLFANHHPHQQRQGQTLL